MGALAPVTIRAARRGRSVQTDDRLPHAIGELAIGPGAVGVLRREPQIGDRNRPSDADFDRRPARQQATLAEGLEGPGEMHRQDVASRVQCEIAGAAFEFVNRAVGRTGALGEHQHAASRREFSQGLIEGIELRALAIERNQPREVTRRKAPQSGVEKIILGREHHQFASAGSQGMTDEAEVKMARVIGNDDKITVGRDVAASEYARLQPGVEGSVEGLAHHELAEALQRRGDQPSRAGRSAHTRAASAGSARR